MDITIVVDFGMTGSAAEWFELPTSSNNPRIKGGQVGKIPTLIRYGERNEVVSWGTGAEKSQVAVEHSFKLRFSRPNTRSNASKHCSDYLYHFCDHVVREIIKKEDTIREKLKAEWHFTTPGIWDVSTTNDFRVLVSEVVHKLLPNCTVVVELTEALASHLFLKNRFQLDTAGWVITCDIGGATIDTAGSINSHEVFPILSEHTPMLSGVCRIDNITSESLQKSSPPEPNLPWEDIVTSWGWKKARHSASGSEDLNIRLDNNLGLYQSDDYTIEGEMMRISGSLFRNSFSEFELSLHAEIDEAIRKVRDISSRSEDTTGTIAFCGGGGTMARMLQTMRVRYPMHQILAPDCPDLSSLATVIGYRLHLQKQALERCAEETQMGMSKDSSSDEIEWKDFSLITTWQFHSKGKGKRHLFVVTRGNLQQNRSIDYLKNNLENLPHTSVWHLFVTLDRQWLRGQDYSIRVTADGKGDFTFAAFDSDNQKIEVLHDKGF
ncbi:hypothetical protein GLAREA_10903 [Glarea lozoyensis ATCC 20868]|uniref:Actin-like ATPase n=1 Tax=Glarea lozoyensis (strain ATCC 20868 / MF5171) TaxID=1116229 RepID=S3DTD0_GLAL2|nr:uncharacterized protein GLAREA_10903 [Glarea lozoyensis ATCC 20868]EPE35206.1 hypothetical protein GLAREA_10903 [Glarea lozoyensis ATCC 20868]